MWSYCRGRNKGEKKHAPPEPSRRRCGKIESKNTRKLILAKSHFISAWQCVRSRSLVFPSIRLPEYARSAVRLTMQALNPQSQAGRGNEFANVSSVRNCGIHICTADASYVTTVQTSNFTARRRVFFLSCVCVPTRSSVCAPQNRSRYGKSRGKWARASAIERAQCECERSVEFMCLICARKQ